MGARACLHYSTPQSARLEPPMSSVLPCTLSLALAYRSPAQLSAGIANFYDASSKVWEDIWGEHMHHGYYPTPHEAKSHTQAQVDMVDAVLEFAQVEKKTPPKTVLDVGCGIGGSTRHLANKFGATGHGITLSPYQASRAQELTDQAGLGDKLTFQVADALNMPFPDDTFDLVWSLESGEHMPDKKQFVSELCRVLRPGGRLIVVAWCHRNLEPGETALLPREQRLLERISKAYYLPRWCSIADYVNLFKEKKLQDVRTDDWTDSVKKFWPAVIMSAFRPRSIIGLFRSGLRTFRGALVMPLMIRGQRRGTIKFGLVTATKLDVSHIDA